jgi:putative transposase
MMATSNAHQLKRRRLKLTPGTSVIMHGDEYLVKEILNEKECIVKSIKSNTADIVSISELIEQATTVTSDLMPAEPDLDDISEADYQIAKSRLEAIKPLLELEQPKKRHVRLRAAEVDCHYTTLYNWLKAYQSTQALTSLIPKRRGWSYNRKRLDSDVNTIIEHYIENLYLTIKQPSPKKVYSEIKNACAKAGLTPPHQSTIYRRIDRVPEEKRLRGRGRIDEANNRFSVKAGKFPGADTILNVVQIDHTPLDIIIVDEETRQSIKRVWLTVAIDVFSRAITGIYLSLDAPSLTSVAMCISHSILPKDKWLKYIGVEGEWNVWGYPKKIHTDNGTDFRSINLSEACASNGIDLEFRPVKRPNYGGHVERYLGAFSKKLAELDGKTFNSANKRESYDPEKHANMTIEDIEKWLVHAVIEYHHTPHSSIGIAPATKWRMGIEGASGVMAAGLPEVPDDPLTLELDFLPKTLRGISGQGVVWDKIHYFSNGIRHLIGERDSNGKSRKYIVRRDPRDITKVWVYDPFQKLYHEVPYADPTHPYTNKWELEDAKRYLKSLDDRDVNERAIFRAIENMREIEEQARTKTKKVRRKNEANVQREKQSSPARIYTGNDSKGKNTSNKQDTSAEPTNTDDDIWGTDVDGFEIE